MTNSVENARAWLKENPQVCHLEIRGENHTELIDEADLAELLAEYAASLTPPSPVTDEDVRALAERLSHDADRQVSYGNDPDSTSYGYEEGVLISINEARKIADFLRSRIGAGVKALEWEEGLYNHNSISSIGIYTIVHSTGLDVYQLYFNESALGVSHKNLDLAKAAAQQDFAERIGKALEPAAKTITNIGLTPLRIEQVGNARVMLDGKMISVPPEIDGDKIVWRIPITPLPQNTE